MADEQDVIQLWGISPAGGEPWQITHLPHSISSVVNWHPSEQRVAFISDNSVMCCDIHSGVCQRLTVRSDIPPKGDAVVWSPDGQYLAFSRQVDGWNQLFIVPDDPQ